MEKPADFRDNKAYLKSIDRPRSKFDTCGHGIRREQVSGPWTPGWFKEGRNDVKFEYRVQNHKKTPFTYVNVKVERCTRLSPLTNGARYCSSYCNEDNVHGVVCNFVCHPGYSLTGPSNITCRGTSWSYDPMPECRPINCGSPPTVKDGVWHCPDGYGYLKGCSLTCLDGYELAGFAFTTCTGTGHWTDTGRCRDVVPPVFQHGCVDDIDVYSAPLGKPALVSWEDPDVQDNGTPNPTITFRLPSTGAQSTGDNSALFAIGTHEVAVVAQDEEGNEARCYFNVTVIAVTCPNPQELNITHMVYRPTHFGPVHYGTTLSVKCQIPPGHNVAIEQQGAKNITCEQDEIYHTARWTWLGDIDAMKPACIVKPCPDLRAPDNGALTCFTSTGGTDCYINCHENFTLPSNAQDLASRPFTCPFHLAVWFPINRRVPDCSEIRRPGSATVNFYIQYFYYNGSCNDSTEILQNNFIQRIMDDITKKGACVTVMSCTAANVKVTCGRGNGKRRRRNTNENYVTVSFDLKIPYNSATTFEDVKTVQTDMRNVLRQEVSNGSLTFDGLTTDQYSVGSGTLGCDCPAGRTCTRTLTCVGCSKGHYMPEGEDQCQECPKDTYQNEDGAVACKPCPPGTSTLSTGSDNITQCKEPEAGGWGEWSIWTGCTLRCGGGQQERQRRCDNPVPEPGGRNCEGLAHETQACGEPYCPVDGGWGNWTEWSDCSTSCGGGEITRSRQCDNPAPEHGGLKCGGSGRESKLCNTQQCPVDGGWGEWSDWSQCSASCEGGVSSRDRVCDNPAPSLGGLSCTGGAVQTKACNTDKCPECPASCEQPINTKEPRITIDGDTKNCTIECLTGFVWAMAYEPQFFCGPETGFNWSIAADYASLYEPPFCSEMKTVSGGTGQFSIPVQHPCLQDAQLAADVKRQVDQNVESLPCKKFQSEDRQCSTQTLVTCQVPKSQNDTRVRRSTEDTSAEQLILVVDISGSIGESTQMQPGTPAYDEYMEVMNAIEESVKMLLENASALFTVTVNGQTVEPEADKIYAEGGYVCPAGTAMQNGFCVDCPAGAYEEENKCRLCPLGQYQDERGSTECKPCPPGLAWETEGAYDVDLCTSPYTEPIQPNDSDDSDNKMVVGVAVGVSVGVIAVAAVVVTSLVYKVKRPKSKKMTSSMLSLNRVHPDTNR